MSMIGVVQNVDNKEVYDFAMEGDSGYNDLRLRMVKNVVERERSGIDYQSSEGEIEK